MNILPSAARRASSGVLPELRVVHRVLREALHRLIDIVGDALLQDVRRFVDQREH